MCLASEWVQPIVYTSEEKTGEFLFGALPLRPSVLTCVEVRTYQRGLVRIGFAYIYLPHPHQLSSAGAPPSR